MRPFLAAVLFAILTTPMAMASDETPTLRVAPGLTLPVTFRGTLPMASGPGAEWHLDLWPDQTFHVRQSFGPERPPSADLGRWSADPQRRAIVLQGGREAPVFLEVRGNGALRLMDREGAPIDSDLPYDLSPGPLDPAELSLPLTGTFRYMADAATFEECLTGRSYPVAMEQDYIVAERGYLALDAGPGAPVFAVLEGALASREAMEGPDRTHLVIERFDRFEPERACPRSEATPTLTNTFWRIVELSGGPLAWADGAPEPFLLLQDTEAPSYNATIGCNMIRGALDLADPGIGFGPGAMTMMACPPPLDAGERTLTDVLSAVASWEISADGTLSLIDPSGATRLRAEAVYLP